MNDLALTFMIKPIIPLIRGEIPAQEPKNEVSIQVKAQLDKIKSEDKLGVRPIIQDLIIGFCNEKPEQVRQFIKEIHEGLNDPGKN